VTVAAVRLTSFRMHHEGNQDRRGASIAVYQPKWYPQLPVIEGFDIRHNGQWTRPRDFMPEDHDATVPDPGLLEMYHDTLLGMYARRYEQIGAWLGTHYGEWDFCCWCPYDKAAKRQLHDYGSFVCHSWAVESYLHVYGIPVERDGDRQQMVRRL